MVKKNQCINGFSVKCIGILIWLATLPTIKLQSQTTLYDYNGVCRIELPNMLELQDSELNNVKRINAQGKKSRINISTPSRQIVFQQKGLNADSKSAYSKYCRVMVNYDKESRSEPVYGRGDPILIDRDLLYAIHESVKSSCNASKTPLMRFNGAQSIEINGFPVIYYSYKRKGWEGKQPPVIVNVFLIHNRYESVSLYFSYRESEREMWKDIHNYILKTFNFTHQY